MAVWDRALSDGEVAFVSGVARLTASGPQTPFDQALLDYNAFFDASVAKDVAACGKLSRSLMEFAARDPERPIYHLSQPLGWLFDPAGAFFYQGRYHVWSYHNIYALLRYNSLDHYVSDDLVHWSQWPIGPWADSPDDIAGVWLNNHFLDDDGVPTAIYCAFGDKPGPDHGILARSRDGLVSFPDKQLILPVYHDGHIWKEGDIWYCLTSLSSGGSRPVDLGNGFSIFTSPDLKHWTNRGEIFARRKTAKNPKGFGEFPYLLSFGDKDVLITGCLPSLYWVGRLDRQNFKFIPDHPEGLLIDYSAPNHCFNPLAVDAKGPGGSPRRIIMAMIPDVNGGGDRLLPWSGVHALPRTLEFDGRHLRQEPLPEFESLRGENESQRGYHPQTRYNRPYPHTRRRGRDQCRVRARRRTTIRPKAPRLRRRRPLCPGLVRYRHRRLRCGRAGAAQRVRPLVSHQRPARPNPSLRGQASRRNLRQRPDLHDDCASQRPKTSQPVLADGLDLFSEGGTARCTTLDVWKMNRAEPK